MLWSQFAWTEGDHKPSIGGAHAVNIVLADLATGPRSLPTSRWAPARSDDSLDLYMSPQQKPGMQTWGS